MKKKLYFILHTLYFILLGMELFIDTLLMISLWDSNLYIPVIIAALAVVGMLVWQTVLFFKAHTPMAKWKIMWNAAFIMLIPMVIFAIVYVVIAIAFIIAFI